MRKIWFRKKLENNDINYKRAYLVVAELGWGAAVRCKSVIKSLIFADWMNVKFPCNLTTVRERERKREI